MPRDFALLVFLIVVFSCSTILPFVSRYSTLLLVSPSSKRLGLTEEDAIAIMQQHDFVFIGGPHRGGTTLLWRLIARHPTTASFAESTDTDYGEGAFLQTALPTFGIGGVANPLQPTDGGLGQYAFSPSSHLTEEHPLNSARTATRLLSDWGYHWNLSKPALLEKTPTNMLTSRLLQALLAPARSVRFLFVSRHPIAVSLAHRRWPSCAQLGIRRLLLHWIVSHRILAADLPRLQHGVSLRYEDLARRPRSCRRLLLAWLQLPEPAPEARHTGGGAVPAVPLAVDNATNAKYEAKYCAGLVSESVAHEHCSLANAMQPAIDALGIEYDLRYGNRFGFGCLRERLRALRAMDAPCDGVPPARDVVAALESYTVTAGTGNADAGARPQAQAQLQLGLGPLICGSELEDDS